MGAEGDSSWQQVPLGTVVSRCDYGLSCSLDGDAGGIPVLRMGNLVGGKVHAADLKYISAVKLPSTDDLLESGDLLLNRTNSADRVGKVGLFSGGFRSTFASYLYRLRVRSEKATPEWLTQVLASPQYQARLRRLATPGVSQTNINRTILLALPVPLPPLAVQRKLASILSSIDDTIEKTQAVINQMGIVKNGVLGRLLMNGMPGRHKEFGKTDIGLFPKSWQVYRLEEVAEVRAGLAKNAKKTSGAVVELPYLRVANVQDGYLDLQEVKTIQVDESLVDRYLLHDGDVLFNEGGDADKVGRGTVWRGQLTRCLHQNHVFAVRPSKKVLSEFLSLYGGSAKGKAYFLDAAKRTTNLASINSSQLRAFPVPLPSLEEQREIVEVAWAVQARTTAEEEVLSAAKAMKAALLDNLLSGKLRVSLSNQEAA